MTQYELFYFLLRNKWLILAGFLAGVVACAVTYVMKPRVYRSEATLLVRYVSDTVVVDPEVSGERVLTPGRPNDTVIGTEVDILSSADLVATAAKALADVAGANTNSAPPAISAREIARNFHVQVARNSSTIRVHLDGPSPGAAQRALQEVIHAYLNKHQEVHRDPGAFEFISQQTDEMRTRVNDAEDELRRVKSDAGIISLADARAGIAARVNDLDRAMRELESALAATRARMQMLSQQLAVMNVPAAGGVTTGQTAVVRVPEVEDGRRRLNELMQRETELLRTYTSNSLPVRSVRRQIEDLKRSGGAPPRFGIATNASLGAAAAVRPGADLMAVTLADYQGEEAALLAQQGVLRQQVKAAQAEMKRIEGVETQILRLERAREIYDTNFRYFSRRLERARIDNALDASKVSNIPVVQPPTYPQEPLTQRLRTLLALILAGFTAGGVALAFVREHVLDHTIRHAFEIRTVLRVPLLTVVPRVRRAVLQDGAPRGDEGSVHRRAVRAVDSACEMVAQSIRERVAHGKGTLLVGFTAPHAGAGVTTLAERVAAALQLSGLSKVLLATVTADGKFVGKLLIENAADGNAAAGDSGAHVPHEGESGAPPVMDYYSPAKAITPGVFFAEFHQHAFDCVLFDLPPLGSSDVAVRLLPRLDGVVLLVETLRTPRNRAVACVQQIEQLHCKTYGAVLNKFRTFVPAWLSPPSATTSPSTSVAVRPPPAVG